MNDDQIKTIAKHLQNSRIQAKDTSKISDSNADFTLDAAYQVQAAGISLRLLEGEKIVGAKMGLTSKAKMEQMGLHSPIYGILTDRMQIHDTGNLELAGLIHPKAEPEVAFVLSKSINGIPTKTEALQAIGSVHAAIEVLDSRYIGFKYFSLEDVVADNSSSSHFLISEAFAKPSELDIDSLPIRFKVNGKTIEETVSNVVLGSPIESLIEYCKLNSGKLIPSGTIILTGAATTAVPLEPNMKIETEIGGVGTATLNVTE